LVEKQFEPHIILESGGVNTQNRSGSNKHSYIPFLLGFVSVSILVFGALWRKRLRTKDQIGHGTTTARRLNQSNPVFPLSPLGYSDNNYEGDSDDEYSFHEVALT
jgi:hypothetical protein